MTKEAHYEKIAEELSEKHGIKLPAYGKASAQEIICLIKRGNEKTNEAAKLNAIGNLISGAVRLQMETIKCDGLGGGE